MRKFVRRFIEIFSNPHLTKHLVRWAFTWGLATVPVIFVVLKEYVNGGDVGWMEIISNGELFLISIVIVAEPLGSLVVLPSGSPMRSGPSSLILSFFIIVDLLCCAFLFCIIEMNEVRIHHCQTQYHNCTALQRDSIKNNYYPKVKCDSACMECVTYHVIAQKGNHIVTDVLLDKHDNNTFRNHSDGTVIADTINSKEQTIYKSSDEVYDDFLSRMFYTSIVCFFWSLILGGITIIHIR